MLGRATYAFIALIGFGVGVYDVNAIESSHRAADKSYSSLAITEVGRFNTGTDLVLTAPLRTTRVLRDSAGRVISQLTGEGQAPQLPASSTFSGMNVSSFLGDVPQTVETLEPIAGAK